MPYIISMWQFSFATNGFPVVYCQVYVCVGSDISLNFIGLLRIMEIGLPLNVWFVSV